MSNATQTYREVQRKANAGERIKIVNAGYADEPAVYVNGDIVTVTKREYDGAIRIDRKWNDGSRDALVFDREYVVLEPIAPTTATLPDLFAQFIRDNAPAVRSYLAGIDPDKCAEVIVEESASEPPLTRAKVIEMARERVAELLRIGRDDDARLEGSAKFRGAWFEIDFVVNRDKRAVTALVYELNGLFGAYTRKRRKPDAVGIAKCAPDDVFNADLGKAIAAERALGLTLTAAFVGAPKPEKAEPGVVIRKIDGAHIGKTRVVESTIRNGKEYVFTNGYTSETRNCAIIDDTDADYTQKAGEAA